MKNILVIAISSLSLSGFSFTPVPADESKQITTVQDAAPVQEMFGYLRVHRQGKGVSVNWGIISSADVAGFRVERSYDVDFFGSEIINQVQCNGSLKYSWKDESVFPGYIYYRIGCVMNDGTIHYSAVDKVRIVQHG